MTSLKGQRVLVMGLGLFGGGVGAAKYLLSQGAEVTVTDLRSEEELAASVRQLDGFPVLMKLGGHDEADFRYTDMVVANPAVPRSSPFLVAANEAGVPVTTEISLFVSLCPARIIGITGSSGKTTTTTMLGEMLLRADARTLVGGNIGGSLLDDLVRIDSDTPVVLELSSFQLDRLGDLAWGPHIAVVTNFAPNHIDVHGSLGAYRAAKRNILAHQTTDDWAIVNADDAEVFGWQGTGRRIPFALTKECHPGAFVRDEVIHCGIGDGHRGICAVDALKLPGPHNLANALAATAAAVAWGVPDSDIASVLQSFSGLPHRLETVAVREDITYVNDSIATSPDRTRVALEAMDIPCILIAGGYDKKIGFAPLGDAIAQKVQTLILIGETAASIADAVPPHADAKIHFAAHLSEAVSLASRLATPGQTVLLSPASASYDQYLNFQERGEHFKSLVRGL